MQNALIWNISPLMSSIQPPLLYTVSLWLEKNVKELFSINNDFNCRSHPYQKGAPIRLLQAQERALLMTYVKQLTEELKIRSQVLVDLR